MELAIIQTNFKEDMRIIMVRFMNNFNHYITYIVELHQYIEVEKMVCMVIKVKKQFKRKGAINKTDF